MDDPARPLCICPIHLPGSALHYKYASLSTQMFGFDRRYGPTGFIMIFGKFQQ